MHFEEYEAFQDEQAQKYSAEFNLHALRRQEIVFGDEAEKLTAISSNNCCFFRVTSLTFEKDFPRQEAFENVVASINNAHCRLVYYLHGNTTGVNFYIGVVKKDGFDPFNINDYGNMLSRAFKGNFLGSELTKLDAEQIKKLMAELAKKQVEFSTLLGVPTRNTKEEDRSFQGVDRLINIMTNGQGRSWQNIHLLVIWEPVSEEEIEHFDHTVKDLFTQFSQCAKKSVQVGKHEEKQQGTSSNERSAHERIVFLQSKQNCPQQRTKDLSAQSQSKEHTSLRSSDEQHQASVNALFRGATASDEQKLEAKAQSEQYSQSQTRENTESSTQSEGTSQNIALEKENKHIQDCMCHIAEDLLPRLRCGRAKGMFNTAIYVGAETTLNRVLLENAIISICQGDKSTMTPLYARPLPREAATNALVSKLGITSLKHPDSRLVFYSRPLLQQQLWLSTVLTAAEISMLAGMPQKEVPGVLLREQVPFGLNIETPALGNQLELGCMMQEGSRLEQRVCLDRSALNKHIFIAGTTGSGKTTTCHRLLASSASAEKPLPFFVIEPAKTEYRALLREPLFAKTVIFTVGNEKGVPFRFNPFEFLPTENLSGHVDLLKACFMNSFDMDAAIPNLLEEGLYRLYESYGWDISDDSNYYLEDRNEAWHCDGRYFPTISSYITILMALVEEKGFDERLKNEYKGSLRARLDSLCTGTKGLIFNTPLSVDFMDLIDKQVILELEELKSGEDKSFIMGLVLGRMMEALKARHHSDPSFRHITLLEEAHRLLTRSMPGDSPNRRLGVESFTDLLAEVRKYGESLIIVDQIPSKLAPEVLKNTNTKIIHRLFAADDKDAVGDTMALDDKQKNYLSLLRPGEAVIFTHGWNKPVNIQVKPLSDISTDDVDIPDSLLVDAGWAYWQANAHIYCPGLSVPLATSFDRKQLREIVRLRNRFWKQVLAKTNWCASLQELRTLAGKETDGILLALLVARDMSFVDQEDRRKQRLQRLPQFVQELYTVDKNNYLQYSHLVESCSF